MIESDPPTEVGCLMDVKLLLVILTVLFSVATLYFGTQNGFYDSDNYHGDGSAH